MSPENYHSPSPEDDALVERRMDQGVWNGAMGRAAVDGAFADASYDKSTSSHRKRPRYSRRGGRSQAEVTGRDIARNIANLEAAAHPVPAEEQDEINKRNLESLAAARRKLQLENTVQRVRERDDLYYDPDYSDISERDATLAMNAAMQRLSDQRSDKNR